ncbi:MAG: hypothetical protein K2J82_00310 [Muribaculaceae bacterium]|nr:hypothetical protein [Muribaculaceae bacterium]
MKIIALRGKGGKGKTTTLIKVFENLKKHGWIVIDQKFLSNNDFKAILKDSKGIITGIVSQGDYVIGTCSVKNHLDWCESKGCIKTVCACTIGPNKEKIETHIASFPDHCFIDKTIESDISKQDSVNETDAALIETYL